METPISKRIYSRVAVTGFTLIELLVVIAIIAILAALLFARAGIRQSQSPSDNLHVQLEAMWPRQRNVFQR